MLGSLKRFIRFSLFNFIWLIFNYRDLLVYFQERDIAGLKPYRFTRWHSGFNYFTGNFNNKKVFIKVCVGEYDTIPTEAHILKYKNLKCTPRVEAFGWDKFHWIATEYVDCCSIDKLDQFGITDELINEAVGILDELYFYGIIHRDLRPENIYVNRHGKLFIIDFGWAVYKDLSFERSSYSFIETILNREFRDDNDRFDDALSMYLSFKKTFPFLPEESLSPIKNLVGRFSA